MTKAGSFSFVLHSHLPYVRRAGMWPHGEEMIHEAICDTYVPLLNALYDLAEEGCPFHIAIGITPVLAEQLTDGVIVKNFQDYMTALMSRVEQAAAHYTELGDDRLPELARFYLDWHRNILESFRSRFGCDLVQAFRKLQDAGHVEVVASAATHPFLPLMSRDSTVRGQLTTGVAEYQRRFGRQPRSLWLPECGYRPAYYDMTAGRATFRPGLEQYLEELGIQAFFADSAAVEGGEVTEVPRAIGSLVSTEFAARVPAQSRNLPYKSTAWPYLVSDSSVAVFGRDSLTGRQVWSASEGYPGHFAYREFHKKDAICGMRFWKITGTNVDLGDKTYYDPDEALAAVPKHVDHFITLLERHILGNSGKAAVPPAIIAPYDTELFGHWWFEGVEWLKLVLRRLATHEHIDLTTPGDYIERYPPTERIALPESSWGAGGDARTWMNDATRWMWPIIHHYERQMEELVARFPAAQGAIAEALAQLARELMLLESSDWPFLISTGQAEAYASLRFRAHAARFDRLADLLLSGQDTTQDVAALRDLDNPFPQADYRLFAERAPTLGPRVPTQ